MEAKNIQDIKIIKRGLPKIYTLCNKNQENKNFQKKLYNFIDNIYQDKTVNSLSIYQIKILSNIEIQVSFEKIYKHWIISVNNENTVLFQTESDLFTLHKKKQISDILYEICMKWLSYMKDYNETENDLYTMFIKDMSDRTLTGFYLNNDESKFMQYGEKTIIFYSLVYNMDKFSQFSEGIYGLDYFFKKYKLNYIKFEKLIEDIPQLDQFKTELRSLESIVSSEENNMLYQGSIFLILSDTKHIVTTFKIQNPNKNDVTNNNNLKEGKDVFGRITNSKTLNFINDTDETKITITQIGNNLQLAKKIFEEDLSENCDFYLGMIPNNRQRSTIQNNPKTIITTLNISQLASDTGEGITEESFCPNQLNHSHQTNNTYQTPSFNNVYQETIPYNNEIANRSGTQHPEESPVVASRNNHLSVRKQVPNIKINNNSINFQKEHSSLSTFNHSQTITRCYSDNKIKDNSLNSPTTKNSPDLSRENKSQKILSEIPRAFLSTSDFSRNNTIKSKLTPENTKNNCFVRVKGKSYHKRVKFLDLETKEKLTEIILIESYKKYNLGNTFIDINEEDEEDEKKKSHCCSIY